MRAQAAGLPAHEGEGRSRRGTPRRLEPGTGETRSREEGTAMVRMDMESAETVLKGKSPREIYDVVRAMIENAPDAKINDLFDTLDWVVANGFATAEELEAVEEEGA